MQLLKISNGVKKYNNSSMGHKHGNVHSNFNTYHINSNNNTGERCQFPEQVVQIHHWCFRLSSFSVHNAQITNKNITKALGIVFGVTFLHVSEP